MEDANAIRPVPSGRRIRETYGEVTTGKRNAEAVRIIFIIKFNFKEGFFFIFIRLS